jgi:L-rhamnose isomerase
MTREEFRRRLLSRRYGSAADSLIEACLDIQIVFNELDAEKILKMPSWRFDMLVRRLNENKKALPNLQRRRVDAFG